MFFMQRFLKTRYWVLAALVTVLMAGFILIQGCRGRTAAPARPFEFKDSLSQYGIFKGELRQLQPGGRAVKYVLSTPLFTDYAVKDRFIVLPRDSSIGYTSKGVLHFPDSTIIVKNFAYLNTSHQKIMIETRLLVKDPADHLWKVMDYLWNARQTDAVRHITGARVPITLLDDEGNAISTNYQVPNTNDCKRCHNNEGVLSPIGPKARNLNTDALAEAIFGAGSSGSRLNQLMLLTRAGILGGMPDISQVDKLPDWKDSLHYTVAQRARAYLDVNCAHCHTKGGDAYNTGLFLEYQQTDPAHIGIMKMPVSAGGGAGGLNFDIIPGNPEASIMPYRMNSTEAGTAMPELARTVVHKEGVRLIQEWIKEMKK
jgi:uncharacterized repeat protein (TIGR03806 family)